MLVMPEPVPSEFAEPRPRSMVRPAMTSRVPGPEIWISPEFAPSLKVRMLPGAVARMRSGVEVSNAVMSRPADTTLMSVELVF